MKYFKNLLKGIGIEVIMQLLLVIIITICAHYKFEFGGWEIITIVLGYRMIGIWLNKVQYKLQDKMSKQ